jgi:hypothetical protein
MLDTSMVQEFFELEPKTFQVSVVGVLGNYLELLEKENSKK